MKSIESILMLARVTRSIFFFFFSKMVRRYLKQLFFFFFLSFVWDEKREVVQRPGGSSPFIPYFSFALLHPLLLLSFFSFHINFFDQLFHPFPLPRFPSPISVPNLFVVGPPSQLNQSCTKQHIHRTILSSCTLTHSHTQTTTSQRAILAYILESTPSTREYSLLQHPFLDLHIYININSTFAHHSRSSSLPTNSFNFSSPNIIFYNFS